MRSLLLLVLVIGAACGSGCNQLAGLTIPLTSVTAATEEHSQDGRSYCRVLITATPVVDSEIHVEIWLPDPERWNRKFLGTGNGGYSSQLSYGEMREALAKGFAVAGSDTGHTGGDLQFAVGHPAKMEDWAYRAVHVMAESARPVLRSYYGQFARHSYFAGCSTGGQQALSEAQRYPADYDGIVAGDPGNDRVHLNVGFLWSWRALNRTPESELPVAKLPVLYNAVMAACDSLDGIKDGIISDPRRCRFDPVALLCKNGDDAPSCLTQPQVDAVREIYAGAHNPRTGERIFPGWVRGSESLPDGSGSWAAYFVHRPEPARVDFWRYWVFDDPNWSPLTFDFDRDVRYADNTLGFVSAISPDLSRFQRAGGKLLIYQGWADPVVPPEDTIRYFEELERSMGGLTRTATFARLFMVPGMGHCKGGPGPDTFDPVDAVSDWVENGHAPDRIVATHSTNKVVDRSRPLCSYPRQAVWTGRGSTDDARNFACSAAVKQQ